MKQNYPFSPLMDSHSSSSLILWKFTPNSPFKFSSMATTLPHHYNKHLQTKTHAMNLPVKILKSSQHPIKNLSFKLFCKQGSLKEAFTSFGTLLDSHPDSLVHKPDDTYAPLLELCASNKALFQGQQVHTHLIKSNVVSDSVFLSTKLVFMYGKCGSISDAKKVFDRMCGRTIFTWNAMMGAYVTNGKSLEAFGLYREMRVSGVLLDSCTFPCVLKACGVLGDLRAGTKVHGLVIKAGFKSTVSVTNALVAIYAKCNDLDGARKLFDRTNQMNDVVSWNSIISAYSANNQGVEALTLFREMQKAGIRANAYTYVAALQACENSCFRKQGREIHGNILKLSQVVDVYVGNALVAMYMRFGQIDEAVRIFEDMDEKDKVTWNSMLAGFVRNGLYNEALHWFCCVLDAGVVPDQVSVISVATASGRLGYLLNGKEIHAYALKNGFDFTLLVGNTLVDMYSKCCCMRYMGRVFDRMSDKDFVSWTTVIAGYAQNNFHEKALELFRQVQIGGMNVDVMMLGSVLLACSGLKCLPQVKEVHGYTLRQGLSDVILQNTILDVYGECGHIDYATRMFTSIESKDVVSWTSTITSYVNNGRANDAIELFHSMQESRVEPDSITLLGILSAVASLSSLKKGKEIHGFILRRGFAIEGSISNSLADMYARCGSLENSYKIFSATKNKNLILWTTMINAYGMHGCAKKAVELFSEMKNQKLIPDHITFLALVYACSHSGLVDEGKRFLEMMKSEYQLEPWPEHYTCLVDLLGRSNRLEEAYQYVKSMPIKPTAEVWCALLGACHVHSNKEIGELAAQKLLGLDPDNPGNYVLISNVFASSGRWKDIEGVRMRMKENGLKKTPGCSWIDVGNKVHTFTAGDKTHPESGKIYKKLAEITEKLEKLGGYVPQTSFVLHNVEEEVKIQMLYRHSERLAIAYGLLHTPKGTPIRITKNLRFCGDCHIFCRLVSRLYERELVVRDASRFHHFKGGVCSCGDFW